MVASSRAVKAKSKFTFSDFNFSKWNATKRILHFTFFDVIVSLVSIKSAPACARRNVRPYYDIHPPGPKTNKK